MLVRETLAMGSYLVFFYIETFLKISDNIISLSIYKRPQVTLTVMDSFLLIQHISTPKLIIMGLK